MAGYGDSSPRQSPLTPKRRPRDAPAGAGVRKAPTAASSPAAARQWEVVPGSSPSTSTWAGTSGSGCGTVTAPSSAVNVGSVLHSKVTDPAAASRVQSTAVVGVTSPTDTPLGKAGVPPAAIAATRPSARKAA